MQDQWKEEKVKLMLAKCLGERYTLDEILIGSHVFALP